MNCPKCRGDIFKAKVIRGQRIKEYPHLIPVSLQCAKETCRHNIRVYISREDLKFVRDRLIKILAEVSGLKDVRLLWEKQLKEKLEKKKSFFDRISRR